VLDHDAPIHGDRDTRAFEPYGGVSIHDALLHEEEADAPSDRLIRDRGDLFRPAENVHDIETHAVRNPRKGRVTALAQDFAVVGVDRDHRVSIREKVAGNLVRRPAGLWRATHDRHGRGGFDRPSDVCRIVQ
jgi:hypothetical protein